MTSPRVFHQGPTIGRRQHLGLALFIEPTDRLGGLLESLIVGIYAHLGDDRRDAMLDGSVAQHSQAACEFGYRRSTFRGRPGIVIGAELRLAPGDPQAISARLESFAASRKANQPTELPSCGSVFLKPPGDFAGRLIEQAGLKGLRIGGLAVSTRHANFFVNLDNGTAEQALELVRRAEEEVERKFGVRLVREFELW